MGEDTQKTAKGSSHKRAALLPADICLQTAALTAGEEAERSVGAEDFACPQHRRRELRVRGAAGEVLGLKGKAAVLFQRDAALAGEGQFCRKLPV